MPRIGTGMEITGNFPINSSNSTTLPIAQSTFRIGFWTISQTEEVLLVNWPETPSFNQEVMFLSSSTLRE